MTNSSQTAAHLETMSQDECLDLLACHDLGRIAILVDEQPHIFPVNYRLGDRIIALRTAEATMLAGASHSRVAFEIDGHDPSTGTAWSVVVLGVVYEITGAVDRQSRLARSLSVRPLAPGERNRWMGIHPTRISGRRFETTG
jgi:nitroimidazol reductase NimA-like FMN-containing flavoprotein (pyridoxamine 5'-phosphate oxidase superfamily)